MPSGIEFINDNGGLILSTEVTPVCLHNKTIHTLTRSGAVPLLAEDGYISAYHIKNPPDRIMDLGIIAPISAFGIFPDRLPSGSSVEIEQFDFKLGIANQLNKGDAGLQLFDASGAEIYNSNNRPINILKHFSIDVSNVWIKNDKGNYTGQWTNHIVTDYWPNRKIALLFTNIPSGAVKFSHSSNIYIYDTRLDMSNGSLFVACRVVTWLQSFSNASIPVDESLRLEFFVVDVTGY